MPRAKKGGHNALWIEGAVGAGKSVRSLALFDSGVRLYMNAVIDSGITHDVIEENYIQEQRFGRASRNSGITHVVPEEHSIQEQMFGRVGRM